MSIIDSDPPKHNNLDVFNNANYRNILELLFPAVLSSTVGQVHIYVDICV